MNRKELIERAAAILRESDTRKPIMIQRHTFTITDDAGSSAKFVVRRKEKDVLYNADDVSNIIDACLTAVIESLKRGEDVTIKGFGTISLHHRAARRTKEPNTGEWCEVEARYVPKIVFGKDMKMAARVYELSKAEAPSEPVNLEEEDD